jgi:Ankyrin repeats (many copies)
MTEVGKIRLFFYIICIISLLTGLALTIYDGENVISWIFLIGGIANGLVWFFGFRDDALIERIGRGDTLHVKNMLAKGANANATASESWAKSLNVPGRTTALMLAVRKKNAELVQALLLAGADRTATDSEGKTAGVIAQEQSSPDLVAMLNSGPDEPVASS